MTRFARAEGSKSCNKKKLEDATPWEEMKAQMKKVKKNKKKAHIPKYTDVEVNDIKDEEQLKESADKLEIKDEEKNNESIIEEDKLPEPVVEKVKSKKKKIKNNNEELQTQQANKTELNTEKVKEGKKKKLIKKEEYIIENDIKYKVFKKTNEKKIWFDLPYEENDYMTTYNKKYIKRENVKEMDDYKKQLTDEGLDNKIIGTKMFKKEDKFHRTLRLELLRAEISKAKGNTTKPLPLGNSLKKKIKKIKKNPIIEESNIPHKTFCEPDPKPKTDFNFEENELMTCYDGYWIFRESLQSLKIIEDKKYQRILQSRNNQNEDEKLTEEEDMAYRRLMKKEKRRENRLLKLHLIEQNIAQKDIMSNNSTKNRRSGKPGNYTGIDYKDGDKMVKFDGFWIKKSAANRLNKLRENLEKEDCSEEEIAHVLKNERRKEERMLKNENKLSCFKCRQTGHMISTCPQVNANDPNAVPIDICFKCGSTEHMARNCTKNKDSSYAHATCFICNEIGHICRECPDNPRGLYPDGGSCRKCGSVEHLQKDCTDGLDVKEDSIMASTYDPNTCIDSIDDEPKTTTVEMEPPKKKQKVVKF